MKITRKTIGIGAIALTATVVLAGTLATIAVATATPTEEPPSMEAALNRCAIALLAEHADEGATYEMTVEVCVEIAISDDDPTTFAKNFNDPSYVEEFMDLYRTTGE